MSSDDAQRTDSTTHAFSVNEGQTHPPAGRLSYGVNWNWLKAKERAEHLAGMQSGAETSGAQLCVNI